jgi:hypothetical protein
VLITFFCSNNLDSLSNEAPLGLVNLKKLELNQNNLVEIPEYYLCECSKLDIMEAAFNKIGTCKVIICQMKTGSI